VRDQAVKSPPFVADVADRGGDVVKRDPRRRARPQQLVKCGRRRQRVEPRGEVYAVEDDRHPLVKVPVRFVRRCRDDRTGFDRLGALRRRGRGTDTAAAFRRVTPPPQRSESSNRFQPPFLPALRRVVQQRCVERFDPVIG